MQSLLTEPVTAGGTGTNAQIPGMQTCGKTGTTDNDSDGWFCGFTPYYTGATWYGYDYNAPVISSTSTDIWAAIMKDLHAKLENKSFKQPSGIVQATVCKDSGLLITDECKKDPRGSRAYTEYFAKGTAPTDYCECHVSKKVCKHSGDLPGDDCDDTETKIFITRENAKKEKAWKSAADAKYMVPTSKCDKCGERKAEEEKKKKEEEEKKKKEEEEKKKQEQNKPTQPETPTQPTQPETPTEPATPETPTQPETPTEPTTPETPTEPIAPETPAEPTTPETPTEPTTPKEQEQGAA